MAAPVIIAGSGRSGTTWVLDSLAEANRCRTIFEPLHPVGVPAASRFAYQYVRPDAQAPELRAFMDRVFSGEMRSLWADYRIRPDRFNPLRYNPIAIYLHIKKARQLLGKYAFRNDLSGHIVKFIRANLMLPWLARQYGLPMVLVIRHPCAVVASRLRLTPKDWSAEKALGRYRDNEAVYELIGERFGVDIAEPMSAAASLGCVWCIENVLPVEWAGREAYMVVAYENLLMRPETEWRRVTDYLGLESVPGAALLGSPSQQTSLDMHGRTFTPQHVERWRTQLSAEDTAAVAEVLERFGCNTYSVDSTMPVEQLVVGG
jgi:hypothetical protein